jgi:uncharacterized Zn-binding protein involved in type VI secretion
MAQLVVMGASAKCSFAQPPGTASLVLVPNMINGKSKTVATIQDNAITNLATFGMCTAPTNPAVIAAQGAPSACIPVITAPWAPGSATVTVGGKPALTSDSKCLCSYLGNIEIQDAGQSDITTG